MTTWDYVEQYPPPLIRLMARGKKRNRTIPLTDEDIAIKARLPLQRVREIMLTPSWDGISYGEMRKFMIGCQFDPTTYADRHRAQAYAKNAKFVYWKKSEMYESHYLVLKNILTQAMLNE